MTDPNIPVTEDELHAFVDNELPPERRGDVEAWLATHPEDAERVQSWIRMAEELHARYDSVADEPIPKRLEIERLARKPRRWIALTTDPVTRLQLRYSLIRLYEARKDSASAERNIEVLYRENPKILGVVRATVDFYWRTKNYPKAIAVLTRGDALEVRTHTIALAIGLATGTEA